MDETLADKIRILAKRGMTAPEIAGELECKRSYAAWVMWADRNKKSRRKWEANYRRTKYNVSPEVRSRVLGTLHRRRSKNRDPQQSGP